jgi:hypothetical protein
MFPLITRQYRMNMMRKFGYGTGEDWAKARSDFEKAWPAVMGSLEKRFAAKG